MPSICRTGRNTHTVHRLTVEKEERLLRFGSCPRCQGDLHLKQDYYGAYEDCIQCGYSKDIPPVPRRVFTPEQLKGKVGRPRKTKAVTGSRAA